MNDRLPRVEGDNSARTFVGEDSRGAVRRRMLELIDEHPDDAEALSNLLDEIANETNWMVWRHWYYQLGSNKFSMDDVRRVFL